MDLMLQPLKKYADFSGRARRKEYWLFCLFILIVEVVAMVIASATGGMSETGAPSGLALLIFGLLVLFFLAIFIPSIAVSFRRLHDTNRSAWWLLLGFIPFFGGLVLLVFMVLDGTAGPNRFGPDPKERGADQIAEPFA